MRNASGKWVKLPNDIPDTPKDISNARKHDRKAALAAIDRLNGPPEPEPIPEPQGPITLGYAFAMWRERKYSKRQAGSFRVGDSSRNTYRFAFLHLQNWQINGRFAFSMPLDDITDLDVEDLQDDLSDRPPTANKVVNTHLRSIFKFARRKRWTVYNPVEGLEPLSENPYQPILSKAEFTLFYAELWREAHVKRNATAWVLLLIANTGARCAEATNISMDEIKGNKWTIPASRAKARKAHTYELASAQQMLIAHNAAQWQTELNKIAAVRNLYVKIRDKLGLPRSGPHALRRHIASIIAEKYGIEAASAHLGHATITQTAQYVKVWQEKRHEVSQGLAKILAFAS